MIIDKTNGRLDEIKAYAKEHDLIESFKEAFARLENYSVKGNDVNLYNDFAPLSLGFSITDQGQFVFNGGFIFHGKHDGFGNGGAPTFSVLFSTEEKTGEYSHVKFTTMDYLVLGSNGFAQVGDPDYFVKSKIEFRILLDF